MNTASILSAAALATFSGPFGHGTVYADGDFAEFDTTNGSWTIDTRTRGGMEAVVTLCQRYARRFFGDAFDAAAMEYDAMMQDNEIGALSAVYGL